MTLIQKDGYSCGPVALSNAITLLGAKPPSVKTLCNLSSTTKNGTYAIELCRAARALGYKTQVVKQRRGHGIFIIQYLTEDDYHFVVSCEGRLYNFAANRFIKKSKRNRVFRDALIIKVYK